MQTAYFGYFGDAWLRAPKFISSTCRRLRCLSTCQEYNSSFTSFLRYYILKNPFARYGIGGEISRILVFIIDYFQEKLMTNFFRRSKKTYCEVILGPFCPNLLKNEFSWKNGLSVFKYFNQLPSCQKP